MYITKSFALNHEDAGSLIFLRGEYIGVFLWLKKKEVIILGRDPNCCNLIFEALEISRKHCAIRFDEKEKVYYLIDYSKNGTFLAEGRMEKDKERAILPGSRVRIGEEEFILG